jgi:hypothetical protein
MARLVSLGDRNPDIPAVERDCEGLHRLTSITNPLPHIHAKAMKRAVDLDSIECTFPKRATCVRAAVVDGSDATTNTEHSDLETGTCLDNPTSAVRDLVDPQLDGGHVRFPK